MTKLTQETNDVVTQELIERLRARRKRELTLSLTGVAWEPLINPDGPEAADALQSQSARIAELEGALERIAKHDVGLQGLIEDGEDTPDNVAKYYAAQVERRRKIARSALEADNAKR